MLAIRCRNLVKRYGGKPPVEAVRVKGALRELFIHLAVRQGWAKTAWLRETVAASASAQRGSLPR